MAASDLTTSGAEQEAVLAAGLPALRDLPWRRTRDPWAILVSEVMLQQTQVPRVVPRWERFLDRWPTPTDCASAPLGDVLAEWQGLGYPRRARNLWLTAQRCVAERRGRLPTELDDLLALPGIGPYTARAVMVFANGADVGVIDTNIARVLARRAGRPLRAGDAQRTADALVPIGRSWEWNQVLMDLGATRCRPMPDCDGCPIECTWNAAGFPEPDPAVGSAGVSGRQAAFAGSDRQLRGRLMAALAGGPVRRPEAVLGEGADRVERIVESLLADGLVLRRPDGTLTHP